MTDSVRLCQEKYPEGTPLIAPVEQQRMAAPAACFGAGLFTRCRDALLTLSINPRRVRTWRGRAKLASYFCIWRRQRNARVLRKGSLPEWAETLRTRTLA